MTNNNDLIIDNRLVSDYTFATRFKNFLKDINVNDSGSYEELEYMKDVASKLLKLQMDTATEQNEINYLKVCNSSNT